MACCSGSAASWAASSWTTRWPIAGEREGVRVRALPACRRCIGPTPAQQFLFVNGRPVKDKLLIGAVRAAYGDLIPKGRHPLLALFVDARPRERSTSTCIRPRPRCASAMRGRVRSC